MATDKERRREHGDRLVGPGDSDFAVNVMAGGPPPWLQSVLDDALASDLTTYPNDDTARRAIADAIGRHPDEIVTTNGASEALWLLPLACKPRHAVCINPCFSESEAALVAHGFEVDHVVRRAEDDFALNPHEVPTSADLVILGNPTSPDGRLFDRSEIEMLRRPGRLVVVDEAFMDLAGPEDCSMISSAADDVIVVRSLTKVLSVPGLRVGYAVADSALAERLRAVQPPWSVNALALAALGATARHGDYLAAAAARARSERADLVGRLGRIEGLHIWPGRANFCLVEIPGSRDIVGQLRSAKIIVRPAGSFRGLTDRFVRITARSPSQNEQLVRALEDALDDGDGVTARTAL